PGAHVEPENVARDLPEIVDATRAAGLEVPMVITAIGNVRAPHAERILETFAELGIVRYRANAPRYDYNRDFAPQYDEMRRDLEALAALNARYGTTACFHTHSAAGGVGGGGWDLWMLMKDLDPNHVGINFDIGHVTARNGNGWRDIAHAARAHIQSLSVKDVVAWQRNPAAGPGDWPWRAEFVPPGEGMVDFDRFFSFFRATRSSARPASPVRSRSTTSTRRRSRARTTCSICSARTTAAGRSRFRATTSSRC